VANILCLDFDDTIVMGNTSRAVFERFGAPEWREHEAEYHAGRLTVEEYNVAAMRTVTATYEELRAFSAEAATIRPGFLELLDWAHWNGWLPVVVSNGFDFYVDAVLDKAGVERVARHTARTRFDYRWLATYLSPRGVDVLDGFKLSYAASFQGMGDFVAYVGDGASDIEAAKLAQAVFARDTLLRALDGVHPRIYPFETFHDVVKVLGSEAAGWLESFSSTTAAED
jgi:2-hydroxy-3-keto-5-methylthiopentenyl-1-phosphate phosphatase